MTLGELAKRIDHTQLRAYATRLDIEELCDEAREHGFAMVTVNPAWTAFCARRLDGSGVGVNPTIGFPLGANTARIKVEETREAIKNGATEVDMVINIGAVKSGYDTFVQSEIEAVVAAAGEAPVKVILENGYLSDDEKRRVCVLSVEAGAAFVKTSTGFGASGATVQDVRLMRAAVGDAARVKAAGGIRTYRDAAAMLEAGADRLGTSAGITILAEARDAKTGFPSSR